MWYHMEYGTDVPEEKSWSERMDRQFIETIIGQVARGELDQEGAMRQLANLPYEDMGFAQIDHHRGLRNGHPEVIFCQGKTTQQVLSILDRMRLSNGSILATRADASMAQAARERFPDIVYHPQANILVLNGSEQREAAARKGTIAVVTAGTADIPVAEEAAVVAETMGNRVERIFDVGVAGIHRLFSRMEQLRAASVIVVVAGMEGALASVVGGLVDKPVIAVPTSVGYGASFGGLAALLTMLNSCAAGVAVVNIDNGFGAGYMASAINRLSVKD